MGFTFDATSLSGIWGGTTTEGTRTVCGSLLCTDLSCTLAPFAEPSEVLVSQTVKDLVAGSGLRFDDRGSRELKGVDGTWHLYAVAASRRRGPAPF
jgi:hypothetical protein